MENSDEKERTYLFSFGQGLQMTMASVGSWIGGYLPTWMGQAAGRRLPRAVLAYGNSRFHHRHRRGLAILPLVFLKAPRIERSQRAIFAPFQYAAKNPLLLTKLILPMLLTSLGAGLIMPFMNVFFRVVHHQPDPVIGTLFAWGSLAMGIGLLLAPPLAERTGKIQLVVITQATFDPLPDPAWLFAHLLGRRSDLLHPPRADEHEQSGLPDLRDGTRRAIRTRHRRQPDQHGLEFRLGVQPHHQRLASGALWIWSAVHRHDHPLHDLRVHVLGIFLARTATASVPVTAAAD